jgi:putative solute:sodium symporter small subunit
MSSTDAGAREGHWTKTRNLNTIIMILWVIFAIIIPYNAASLNSFNFLGFPLGYYMCVWIQNWRQDQIDDEYGVGD